MKSLTEETQHMIPQSPTPQFTLIYISQEPIDTDRIIDGNVYNKTSDVK